MQSNAPLFFKEDAFAALCTVNTSCQWATLSSIVSKMNKKLTAEDRVNEQSLASFLANVNQEELNDAGVWVHWFGNGFLPILVTNSACARARRKKRVKDKTTLVCSCKPDGKVEKAEWRFFGSTDYHAGRHALKASGHLRNCACWTPPSTGHMHSWRKGFDS